MSSWQPPACLPARSLAPSHRGPGSHTICHLAPPAVSHAWPQPARDKMVWRKGKGPGHTRTQNAIQPVTSHPRAFRKREKHIYWEKAPPLKISG